MVRKPTKVRILPPNAYDYLELIALAEGGIGKGADFTLVHEDGYSGDRCLCIWGMAQCATLPPGAGKAEDGRRPPFLRFQRRRNTVEAALFRAGITRTANDAAVGRVIRRQPSRDRIKREDRITFRQWCRELRVVRGTVPQAATTR